jgi:hypothetical protein
MPDHTPLSLVMGRPRLGQRPKNALRFEPGQLIGEHTIVQRVATWAGVSRWQLRCPQGHFFERSGSDVHAAQLGKRGPLRCRECHREGILHA